jgi:hypothetical protein
VKNENGTKSSTEAAKSLPHSANDSALRVPIKFLNFICMNEEARKTLCYGCTAVNAELCCSMEI